MSEDLKKLELNMLNIEGKRGGDWIILDVGDIIIHLFRSEVREYYNLEKMWTIN
ncbi:MAG: ribosome silencing factor [Pseudomonadota bacterium]|nr:ribosome silencing factor [Pseudomonadota bacterium]